MPRSDYVNASFINNRMRRLIVPVKKTVADSLEKTARLPLTVAKYTGNVAGEVVRGFAGRVFGPSMSAIGKTFSTVTRMAVGSCICCFGVLLLDLGYNKYKLTRKKMVAESDKK